MNYNFNNSATDPAQEYQFRLSINTGPVSPNGGDIWEFSVDNYLGNIETREHEILVAPLQSDGRLNSTQISLNFFGGI